MEKEPTIVALEEHYLDRDISATYSGYDDRKTPHVAKRLDDLGALRIKEMDEAGIDIQVISHGAPSVQKLDPDTAVRLARQANDRLFEACRNHPGRLAAFATLPTPDPKAAADELERCVDKLGFKGGMVHGLTNGLFFDDKRFWPVFERAQALDVPLYMHPAVPHPAVIDIYYKDYADSHPTFLNAAWGFTVECGTQGIRLVLSGVFDAYPGTKIIMGHLGETLPYLLWRIDQALSRTASEGRRFRDYFSKHFYVTTSGNFSTPALLCCGMELGMDRILFSVDWPFVDNKSGTDWVHNLPINAEDKAKILSNNAKRLLRL